MKICSLALSLGLFLLTSMSYSAFAEILPSDRRIDWSKAGIPGGIPNRTVIFANVKNAPYNAKGDGITDDTEAIQAAVNDCPAGQVVYLPTGVYKITYSNVGGWDHAINIRKGIVLRGAGPGLTKITPSSRSFDLGGGYSSNYVDIVSGYSKGSKSMKLASTTFTSAYGTTQLAVGDYLVIDQNNDQTTTVVTSEGLGGTCGWCGYAYCSSDEYLVDISGSGGSCDGGNGSFVRGNRSLGQIIKVTAVNGRAISFEPALYWNYVTSAKPRVLKLSGGVTEYAGLEDLTIDQSEGQSGYSVGISHCAYCWLKNIEIAHTYRYGVSTTLTYRNEYRNNYFHHAYCYPGNYGYGISFGLHGTANLVENNIFDNLHVPIAREGGGGGNVIAYNYFDHGRYNTDCGSSPLENVAMPGSIIQHGAHPVFDLQEGNVTYKLSSDVYWGTASHITIFRNRVSGYDPTYYPNMVYEGYHYRMEAVSAISLAQSQHYFSFIGNILGTADVSTTYEIEGDHPSEQCWNLTAHYKYIYHLGYASDWRCTAADFDALTPLTALRHGNFDYVTNTVIWDPANADHTLPASLYRTSKPSWWGSQPWPPIGPDVAGYYNKIPAQLRYEYIIGGPATEPPSAPRALTVK
jgi:hypothetical protein